MVRNYKLSAFARSSVSRFNWNIRALSLVYPEAVCVIFLANYAKRALGYLCRLRAMPWSVYCI